ncbi:Acetate kinase [bioreactor metagenome]|uniref:Acetate kinase n=1 Tax=bioreactor metagenome TaxID=1076179 RepID=A0A645IR90_9ZZZZ
MTRDEIEILYAKQSGFLGMSGGISSDLRDIEKAADTGNEDAINAVASYCYNIKKTIGAYTVAMGGLDAIAFAGGIGENSAAVRYKVCEGLAFLGVNLDTETNENPPDDGILSQPGSKVTVLRIFTNEEIVVARKAMDYLKKR